jgi:hypothetical protein
MSGINMMLLSSSSTPVGPAGTTWVSRNANVGFNRLWSVASSGTLRVAIGDTVVTRSVDGMTGWTNTGIPLPFNFGRSITWYNGLFIVAGFNSNFQGAIATSPDGITWTVVLSGVGQLLSVSLAENLLIASGTGGIIFTSTDGISWTSRVSGTSATLRRATRGGSIYVLPGSGGTILTSPDGVTWTSQFSGTTDSLWEAVYVDPMFVIVGDFGRVLKSFNTTSWSGLSIAAGGFLGAAYSGTEIIAVGPIQSSQARVYRSIDAFNNWSVIIPVAGYGGTLWSVIWDSFQFIAVGDDGALFTSSS